MSANSDQN